MYRKKIPQEKIILKTNKRLLWKLGPYTRNYTQWDEYTTRRIRKRYQVDGINYKDT